MKMSRSTLAILILAMAGILFAEAGDGKWLLKVPAKDRARSNPFASNPDAPAAGAKIFAEHCAPCHGEDAAGKAQGKHIRPTSTTIASNRPRPANCSGFSPTVARKTVCPPGAVSPTHSAGNSSPT